MCLFCRTKVSLFLNPRWAARHMQGSKGLVEACLRGARRFHRGQAWQAGGPEGDTELLLNPHTGRTHLPLSAPGQCCSTSKSTHGSLRHSSRVFVGSVLRTAVKEVCRGCGQTLGLYRSANAAAACTPTALSTVCRDVRKRPEDVNTTRGTVFQAAAPGEVLRWLAVGEVCLERSQAAPEHVCLCE